MFTVLLFLFNDPSLARASTDAISDRWVETFSGVLASQILQKHQDTVARAPSFPSEKTRVLDQKNPKVSGKCLFCFTW
jgi:hypothetical protein